MTLSKSNVVDAIGIDLATGMAVLSIIDDWPWKDEVGHLLALQEKLNAYFSFIESGEFYQDYPDYKKNQFQIDILSKFAMPQSAVLFVEKASITASLLNVDLQYRQV